MKRSPNLFYREDVFDMLLSFQFLHCFSLQIEFDRSNSETIRIKGMLFLES